LRSLRRNKEGVSEIIGALLLIVIVVVAAAAVAYFVATTEQQATNRQSLINSAQNENLQIVSITPVMVNSSIDPSIDFQLVNSTSSLAQFYVVSNESIYSSSVMLINATDYNDTSYIVNITNGNNTSYYNQIVSGATASITLYNYTDANGNLIYNGTGTIDLSGTGYTFETAGWSSVEFMVRNLNVQSSYIHGVMVNDIWQGNWSSYTNGAQNQYSLGSSQIVVPTGQSVNMTVDLINYVPRTSSLTVSVETPYANVFQKTIMPPTAVASDSLGTEWYSVTSRDFYNLYGTSSYANSGASIQNYTWRLDIPNVNGTPNWNTLANITTVYVGGDAIQYRPEDIFNFNSVELNNLTVNGPIRATLEVVDSNGLVSYSQPIFIPADPNIVPANSMTLVSISPLNVSSGAGSLTVNVQDILGTYMNLTNVPVYFYIIMPGSGNPSPSQLVVTPVNNTDTNGDATTNFTWNNISSGWSIEARCGSVYFNIPLG